MRILFLFLALIIITGCGPAVPKRIDADKVSKKIKNLNYICKADFDGDVKDDLFLIFSTSKENEKYNYHTGGIFAFYKKEDNNWILIDSLKEDKINYMTIPDNDKGINADVDGVPGDEILLSIYEESCCALRLIKIIDGRIELYNEIPDSFIIDTRENDNRIYFVRETSDENKNKDYLIYFLNENNMLTILESVPLYIRIKIFDRLFQDYKEKEDELYYQRFRNYMYTYDNPEMFYKDNTGLQCELLEITGKYRDILFLNHLIKNKFTITPATDTDTGKDLLLAAVKDNDLEFCKALIKAGVNVHMVYDEHNRQYPNILYYAATHGFTDSADLLYEAGLRIDYPFITDAMSDYDIPKLENGIKYYYKPGEKDVDELEYDVAVTLFDIMTSVLLYAPADLGSWGEDSYSPEGEVKIFPKKDEFLLMLTILKKNGLILNKRNVVPVEFNFIPNIEYISAYFSDTYPEWSSKLWELMEE